MGKTTQTIASAQAAPLAQTTGTQVTSTAPTATGAEATAPQSEPVAQMLQNATGYTPSQVSPQPACGAPAPGEMSCDSELLVSKSTGEAVHPLPSYLSAATTAATTTSTTPAQTNTPLSQPFGPAAAAVQAQDPAPYTPGFIQEAYDTGWLSATAGTGKTIAIVDAYDDPTALTDLAMFRSEFGLPTISTTACTPNNITINDTGTPCIVEVNQTGQTSPLPSASTSWAGEESLDLDAVSSLCPNCNILFIEAKNTNDENLEAADEEALKLGAKLLSNSFGGPQSGDGDMFTSALDKSDNEAGVEAFASTGDYGAYADDGYAGSAKGGQTSASQVPYPASEPAFTAVGGTSLNPSSDARGIDEVAWSGAGSACSTFDPQPSWQVSVNGVDVDTGCNGRAVSDISADADPDTGIFVYDTYGDSGWDQYGGTSLAAPLAAAYMALTGANDTSTTSSDGSLSAEWAYADASQLNDITSGSNGTCPADAAYNAFQICNAGSGWDGPTGVGSINGALVAGGPSLTVPSDGGIDNGGNGYSIVQSLSGTSATFDGGVYPNGSDTHVWWEDTTNVSASGAPDFSASAQLGYVDVGAGTAPVAATSYPVSGLTSGTVYYVEECASHGTGTGSTCGNVTEFTTGSGPSASGAAIVGGTSLEPGGEVSVTAQPVWSPAAPTTSTTYQWQESSTGSIGWSDLSSTTSAYTIQPSDADQYLRLEITATDVSGSTVVYSNVLQIENIQQTSSGNTTQSGQTGSSGDTGSSGGTGSTGGTAATGGTSGSSGTTPSSSATTTTTTPNSTAKSSSASPTFTLKIVRASQTLSTSTHQAVARIRRTIVKPKRRGARSTYRLALTRVASFKGTIRVRACVLKRGKTVSCTAYKRLDKTLTLSVMVATGETVELVATL